MKTRNALPLMLAALIAAGGCASITKGTTHTINVEVDGCGEKTECTATNKKGTWIFDAPGPVTVKKSDDALALRCVDGDEYVTRTVAPNNSGMVWGNAVFGGVIGAAVDANTDAHWEYPETVTINRQNCPED
ncbi:MAG: hypothetical protein OXH52_04225 [Gammaproteobacteria bacterium]|nr:hypothetical protein [Gammaproteobacteria bacterium]